MSKPYSTLPHKTSIQVEPFTVSIPQNDLDDLQALLKLTRIPKETFENSKPHPEDYGVTREWFIKAREAWMAFDWYVPPLLLLQGELTDGLGERSRAGSISSLITLLKSKLMGMNILSTSWLSFRNGKMRSRSYSVMDGQVVSWSSYRS
jgi:hypothetical protein